MINKKYFIKSLFCQHCKKGLCKEKLRRNFPFGKNSKAVYSKWVICKNCGNEEFIG